MEEEKDGIKKRMIEHRLKKYQKNREEYEPSGKWNASMLGTCMRKHYWKRLNIEPTNPPKIEALGKMEMGRQHEEKLINEFKEAGMKIDWEQEPVEYKGVVGLIDCRWKGLDEILEIKSQQSYSFWHGVKEGTMLKYPHKIQLALYLIAKNKQKGRVVYVSKDDNTIEECGVSLNEDLKDEIDGIIKQLDRYWDKKELPPAEPVEQWECSEKWCPYFNKCQEEIKKSEVQNEQQIRPKEL